MFILGRYTPIIWTNSRLIFLMPGGFEPIPSPHATHLHRFDDIVFRVNWKQALTIADFNRRHVYFQKDQREAYLGVILRGLS